MSDPKPPPRPDWSSRAGAEALAKKLDAYWHAQGFPQVNHWVEQGKNERGAKTKCWAVKSNLIGGSPPPPEKETPPPEKEASWTSQSASMT